MATNYGAFFKGDTNRIAWSENERLELLQGGWQQSRRKTERPVTTPKSKLGPITKEEIRHNTARYKSLQERPSSVPLLAEQSLKIGVSNAQRTFMGGFGPSKKFSNLKMIPQVIRKGKGLLGKMAMGAVSMLNINMMKLAGNKFGTFERYMKDGAIGKNILNSTRVGKSIGLAGGAFGAGMATVGLANALSTNRHGRG